MRSFQPVLTQDVCSFPEKTQQWLLCELDVPPLLPSFLNDNGSLLSLGNFHGGRVFQKEGSDIALSPGRRCPLLPYRKV